MAATQVDWLNPDAVASLTPEYGDFVEYMPGNGYAVVLTTDDAGQIYLCSDINGAEYAVFRVIDPGADALDEVTTDDQDMAVSAFRALAAKYL